MNDNVDILGYVNEDKHISGRVISRDGLCFTLMAVAHGWGQGYIIEYDEK